MSVKNTKNKEGSLFSSFGFKTKIYFLFTFLLTLYTLVADLLYQIIKLDQIIEVIKKFISYFTNHAILSILIILVTFFFEIKNKKKYSFFCFLVLVNALLTFCIFNLFLKTYSGEGKHLHPIIKLIRTTTEDEGVFLNKNIISVLQHIFIPLFYFILFFFFIPFYLKGFKKICCSYLHPLLYLFIFFFILLFKNNDECMNNKKNGEIKCWLPYPNIQCNVHGQVLFENENVLFENENKFMVLARILFLSFLFGIFFFVIFLLKNKFNEKKFDDEKKKTRKG